MGWLTSFAKSILSWLGPKLLAYVAEQIKEVIFKWKRKSEQKKALKEYEQAVEDYQKAPPELLEEKQRLLMERRRAFENLFNP